MKESRRHPEVLEGQMTEYVETVYGMVPSENWARYMEGRAQMDMERRAQMDRRTLSEVAGISKLIVPKRRPAIVPPRLRTVEEFLARATGGGDEQLVTDLRRMLEGRGGQWW